LAKVKLAGAEWVARPGEGRDGWLRNAIQPVVRIAEQRRQRASNKKMEPVFGLISHKRVFVLDCMTQCVQVDGGHFDRLNHVVSPPQVVATGRPAARHSGKPSSKRRTRKPRDCSS